MDRFVYRLWTDYEHIVDRLSGYVQNYGQIKW